METATGARRQPLVFKITTAGDDPVSPCGDEHDYACKVLDGILVDETYFAFIAHADRATTGRAGDVAKANPNYGVSVKPDGSRGQGHEGEGDAVGRGDLQAEAAEPLGQRDGALLVGRRLAQRAERPGRKPTSRWRRVLRGRRPRVEDRPLRGVVLLFPPAPGRPKWRLIQRHLDAGGHARDRAHRDRAPYPVWVDQGWLLTVPRHADRSRRSCDRRSSSAGALRHPERSGSTPGTRQAADEPERDGFAEEQVLEVPQTYAGMSRRA
jgi:hypothetical protein